MSEPQGTHRVRSDDSETTGVDPQVATAVAESDPGGRSSQDELKKLPKDYITTDADTASLTLPNFPSKVPPTEQIALLEEKDEARDTALHHAAAKETRDAFRSFPGDESTRDKVGKGLESQISQRSEELSSLHEQLEEVRKACEEFSSVHEQLAQARKDSQNWMEHRQSALADLKDRAKEQTEGFIGPIQAQHDFQLESGECCEDSLAAINKYKGATEEKIIVKRAQDKVSPPRREEMGELSESTHKILIGLTAELSHHGEQMARLMREIQALRTELHELRLTDVEQKAVVTLDMPADSLTHPTMEQRDETPTGVEMPDEAVQTSGSTLESPSSNSASIIPLVMHPTSENQTSSVVRLGGQSNPAAGISTLIAELESISIEIGRILDRVEAGHSIMILDPDDHHKIYILGVDVKKGQVEFRALTSRGDFELFTIIPHNLVAVHNGLPQYIKQFMPFNLEKAEKIEGEITYSTNHAKCQLIVHSSQKNEYYGVTVAHAFLSDKKRIHLWDKDRADVLAIEDEIARNRKIDWCLIGPHCRKREQYIDVTRSPLIRHRLYFDDQDKIQEDLAVFEISKSKMRRQLPNYPGPINDMMRLAVFTSGFNEKSYTVKGIIPIRTFEEIKLLVGKRVLIAFAEGKVTLQVPTPPPRSVQRNNMKLGLMLTFVTTSQYSLEPGHSGYMVYLVDKDDRHVYIAGMLTGKINCPDLAKVIYTAALVGAGLEMHSILNLKPLIDGLQGHTVQTLRDDLQGIGSLDPRNPLA